MQVASYLVQKSLAAYLAMETVFILYLLFVYASVASAQDGTCQACNCQFNNLDVLNQLIDSRLPQINETLTGVTYIRWGRTTCPTSTGAELVYSGRVGGSKYNAQGGSSDKVCVPDNPDYIAETSGVTVPYNSTLQGAEYEFFAGPLASITEHNAPCAVCYVPSRATVIMVPAKTTCPLSWTREYYGYLTTNGELPTHQRSSYTCLDVAPEIIDGLSVNTNPSLFHYTVTDCNGLSCPPFEMSRVLACAVCTK